MDFLHHFFIQNVKFCQKFVHKSDIFSKNHKKTRDDSIDLQLENRLLRQEMNSLNLEISRLIDSQRRTDRELELANQELQRRKRRNISERRRFF